MMITRPEVENGIAVVAFTQDSLDASNAKLFREDVRPVLEQHNCVLLDLGALQFVDSSGLGSLLSSLRTMSEGNGSLALCNMTKPVRTLFELVRMFRVFNIYSSRYEALKAMDCSGTTPK
ncbi:MAG: STAS domain-containing protein [Candidatus Hydrogenedentes bacterium]|nr:STAS domain-containing protein [Candidatus Hydrogenedentota bacterium]